MKKLTLLTIFLGLAITVAACGGAPKGTPYPVDLISANPADPASVVQAFFVARSAMNTEAALGYLAPDIQITTQGNTVTGLEAARDFIEKRAKAGYQFELSDVQTSGDQVDFKFKVYQNGQFVQDASGRAAVRDGKIYVLTLE